MKKTNWVNARFLFLAGFIFILAFVLIGCSRGSKKETAAAGHPYSNTDLGFKLTLPPEFDYFQTQRINGSGHKDIEIFVPTADTDYPQEVEGYAKPLVVRVFSNAGGADQLASTSGSFIKVGEKGDRSYSIEFWTKAPSDWQDKWNDNTKAGIINSFTLL